MPRCSACPTCKVEAGDTGEPDTGAIEVELFGNCWTFPAGHTIQLEIAQTDAPFLRPDNLPSSIALSSVRLTLPIRSS